MAEPTDDDPHTAAVASALADGVRALREGRPADAVPLLVRVADDRALAASPELRDVRARALSLCAEALLLAGRTGEAVLRAQAAVVAARAAGDVDGVDQVERLQQRIARAAPAEDPAPRLTDRERTTLRAAPLEGVDAVYGGAPAELRADWLLRRATVAVEDGDLALGEAAVGRALVEGRDLPRVVVLGALLLARIRPGDAGALLQSALDAARSAQAHTLVGAVVREAGLAGVELD